ncbi:VCBS repeat-containing protein [Rhodocytophaga rosea]|uniref:VCBS repeat-containing protein n=1 Tax=Rhodocytophaga rosea TaxID=2704465 RepID=A0A6C0GTL8_9BACT|nr:VCBS repeat-containing protein [Rhodocytophaga rosea]QHT71509.1 VCBS repeat-containing protein [Rhodocytophaga rosea]
MRNFLKNLSVIFFAFSRRATQYQERKIVKIQIYFAIFLCSAISWQCTNRPEPLFQTLDADDTGIRFSNTIHLTDSLSVLDFEYIFNGGGVAVGDINNDGLQDIYFTGNMTSGKLYLNKGNWQFEDITDKAGVGTKVWANGAVMVDINQDGLKDMYVCVGGSRNTPEKDKANLLFINQGNAAFVESASQYGLADTGYGIQSAFFDYDGDGDLDMYLLRNAFVDYNRNTAKRKQIDGTAASTDKLFRNNGDHTFTDVSTQAGITIEGFGLGVQVCDINNDNWPDIYVSNDFITNDLLWINNQNGTFSNQAGTYLKHQTYNGMGNDVADYNNDGLVDIVVLDMLPEDNKRWKLTSMGNNYDEFYNSLTRGYEPQYVRNTLQLNNGNGTFSEIGQLAGIEATEWSWASLFADYDNDGLKDLFITNGYRQDITNRDFILGSQKAMSMGTPEANRKERIAMLNELPGIKVPNYIYKNKGDLTFSDQSASWGFSAPTYSNGAVYADLDNDGDLDLVVNNIDDAASVQENHLNQLTKDTNHANYLRIAFKGPPLNREGLGTKVFLRNKGTLQYQYFTPFRGYLSSIEYYLHFGLGGLEKIDSLEVLWPDGKYQLLTNVKANQVLQVDYAQAREKPTLAHGVPVQENVLFTEVSDEEGISYLHRENEQVDFKRQPLLPHMHSRLGPGLSVGDVNSDGLEDVYIGGATGYAGALFVQSLDGRFERRTTSGIDSLSEETGVLFFDSDNDKDLDLYVGSGGSDQLQGSALYGDQLYLNDGKGHFSQAQGALPSLRESTSCVVAADYDRDGDLDLFVGARLQPGAYPMTPRSVLLRNESGKGECRFTDVTQEVALGLEKIGMVSGGLWSDYDGDGWVDLLVAGEFMPLTFFHNQQGKLVQATSSGLAHSSGWWNSLVAADFDKDGDIDYMAGNLGLNTRYRASEKEPLCVYGADYNKDGRIDPVMSYYNGGEKYILHARDELVDQIPAMRGRFRSYRSYAEASFEDSFLPQELAGAYVRCSEWMESSYIENKGKGKFALKALPIEAQVAPLYGMVAGDYDGDGNEDVLAVGNSYSTEVATGRYDALQGVLMKGDGRGGFRVVKARQNGFMADRDGKGMARLVSGKGRELMVVGNNADSLQVYEVNRKAAEQFMAQPMDAYAEVELRDGSSYRQEFYYGSSYLSHSSRTLPLTDKIASVAVFDFSGKKRIIHPDLHAKIK